jgi:hypothetical protein
MERWRLELSGDHHVRATPVSGSGERNPNAPGQAGNTSNQEGATSTSRGQSAQHHGARSGSYIMGRDILCLAFRDADSPGGSQTGGQGAGAARSDSQRGTDVGRSDRQRAGQSGRSADQSTESRTGGQGHGMSGDRFIVVLRKGSAGQYQQNTTGGTNR